MRYAAFTLSLIHCGLSQFAFAQVGIDPALQPTKTCAQNDRAELTECLDLSSRVQQSAASSSATSHWILSETTSPVNYSPLVVATTSSRSDSERAPSLLSISCRNGRTEVSVTRSSFPRPDRSTDDLMVARQVFMVTHRVNDQPAVQQPWKVSATGNGASFGGDVVRFLKSLPDRGEIDIRVSDNRGISYEARFLLDGVSTVRDKVAAACKWPNVSGAPRQ
jgi:type VI secretion system (T6SS) VasI/EvfG family protein